MWDESRAPLGAQVLEQFCAPGWYEMALRADVRKGYLHAVVDTSKLASRKTDEDLRERTLEVAKLRMAWRTADLAGIVGAVGLTTRGVNTACGIVLRDAGWTRVYQGRGIWWVDAPALQAWMATKPKTAARKASGLPEKLLKRFSGRTSVSAES